MRKISCEKKNKDPRNLIHSSDKYQVFNLARIHFFPSYPSRNIRSQINCQQSWLCCCFSNSYAPTAALKTHVCRSLDGIYSSIRYEDSVKRPDSLCMWDTMQSLMKHSHLSLGLSDNIQITITLQVLIESER